MYATLQSYWRQRSSYAKMTTEALPVAHRNDTDEGARTGPQPSDSNSNPEHALRANNTMVDTACRQSTNAEKRATDHESARSESALGCEDQERRRRADAILVGGDGMIAPMHRDGPHSVKEKNNASEDTTAGPTNHKGLGPTINLDLDIVSSMRKHPFKVLAASPLLLIAATSLAVFTVSALLCEVIVPSGEGSDEKLRSAPQDEQTKQQRVTALKEDTLPAE